MTDLARSCRAANTGHRVMAGKALRLINKQDAVRRRSRGSHSSIIAGAWKQAELEKSLKHFVTEQKNH
jgi:hypothetical protein